MRNRNTRQGKTKGTHEPGSRVHGQDHDKLGTQFSFYKAVLKPHFLVIDTSMFIIFARNQPLMSNRSLTLSYS